MEYAVNFSIFTLGPLKYNNTNNNGFRLFQSPVFPISTISYFTYFLLYRICSKHSLSLMMMMLMLMFPLAVLSKKNVDKCKLRRNHNYI